MGSGRLCAVNIYNLSSGNGGGGIGDDWSKGKRIERGAGGERGWVGTN